ncbi:gamma-taxilin isoform X4 [Mirounga angustirostris]|uniref:gamma-taxilin isoform X4 n=1 Tax=Mirounga angustirostris TaxID=9716 RepID=UPI00313CC7B2
MATRVEEVARGRGGGAEEAIEAGRGGRRRSPRQKFVIGTMEEAGMCGLGVKTDMLHNSQSNDILQHQDSNCGGTSNKHSLEEDEGSDFIRKNRSLMSPAYCTQESREEIPGREARIDPPDGQQDSECNRNKEKTLGKEVLLLMQALNTLSTPEEKLAALCKKYADLHIDKVFKHKELQQQLVDAKLQQTTQLIKEADEKHQREREFLLKEATESRHKYEQMKQQEVQLKQQLSLYMDKFEEFQTTMAKSNELFTTFRQEMEKMTKKIKKLEKETIIWRTKWENNNKALLQMAEEKTVRDKEYKAFQIKLDRLEKLCRALQTERNELNERVEVLKEQVLGRAAGDHLALPGTQPCTGLVAPREPNTASTGAPGGPLEAMPRASKEKAAVSAGAAPEQRLFRKVLESCFNTWLMKLGSANYSLLYELHHLSDQRT